MIEQAMTYQTAVNQISSVVFEEDCHGEPETSAYGLFHFSGSSLAISLAQMECSGEAALASDSDAAERVAAQKIKLSPQFCLLRYSTAFYKIITNATSASSENIMRTEES